MIDEVQRCSALSLSTSLEFLFKRANRLRPKQLAYSWTYVCSCSISGEPRTEATLIFCSYQPRFLARRRHYGELLCVQSRNKRMLVIAIILEAFIIAKQKSSRQFHQKRPADGARRSKQRWWCIVAPRQHFSPSLNFSQHYSQSRIQLIKLNEAPRTKTSKMTHAVNASRRYFCKWPLFMNPQTLK